MALQIAYSYSGFDHGYGDLAETEGQQLSSSPTSVTTSEPALSHMTTESFQKHP